MPCARELATSVPYDCLRKFRHGLWRRSDRNGETTGWVRLPQRNGSPHIRSSRLQRRNVLYRGRVMKLPDEVQLARAGSSGIHLGI